MTLKENNHLMALIVLIPQLSMAGVDKNGNATCPRAHSNISIRKLDETGF